MFKFSWNMAISEKKKIFTWISLIFYHYLNPYESQRRTNSSDWLKNWEGKLKNIKYNDFASDQRSMSQ